MRAPSLAEELSQVNGTVEETTAVRTNEFKPNVYYHQRNFINFIKVIGDLLKMFLWVDS